LAVSSINPDELAQFRTALLQKRRRLAGDVAMMSEEALGSDDGAIDNHAPIHPAEVGSHSFEQEFTLGLLSHDGDRIQLIEMALEKLDEGTYGLCDECGAKIPKARLEMLPESIYCVKCAGRMEGSQF
jgi:RNA polymerase-binding transcription factor DksA